MEEAIFAAGCFWGVQYYFDQIPGVIESSVGYTGGIIANPTYEQVCEHNTKHAEAVKLKFDPKVISYKELVRQFFRMHDPTQLNRQGPDVGDNYRSAIFYLNDSQKEIANQEKAIASERLNQEVVTEITRASDFYLAEDYHQKFAERTGRGMCHIPYEPVAMDS